MISPVTNRDADDLAFVFSPFFSRVVWFMRKVLESFSRPQRWPLAVDGGVETTRNVRLTALSLEWLRDSDFVKSKANPHELVGGHSSGYFDIADTMLFRLGRKIQTWHYVPTFGISIFTRNFYWVMVLLGWSFVQWSFAVLTYKKEEKKKIFSNYE